MSTRANEHGGGNSFRVRSGGRKGARMGVGRVWPREGWRALGGRERREGLGTRINADLHGLAAREGLGHGVARLARYRENSSACGHALYSVSDKAFNAWP